ncbi:vacuolar protein sorting-associated protein 4-like [Dermacentor variabilis]|uniref:vacuolar protein sorting-associated protein 4-like n=1 Tax=Dermacentor variabilis TaxID=34621 RepID=UPI003F5C8194
MVIPVTLINDIKAAVDLSNQANVEDSKKQFANAIRLYRKAMESYLNAALLIRNTCAPFVERAQKLKEFAGDAEQEVVGEGIPDLKKVHQIALLSQVLPPWCTAAGTVISGKKLNFNDDIQGIDPTKLVLTQILSDPKAKAASTILLHGPHGTGKSFLAKSLYVKYPEKSIFIVDVDQFVNGGITHNAPKMAQMLVRNYKKHNTGVLVLDGLDQLYLSDYPDVKKPVVDAVKTELLNYMKDLAEKKEYKEIVIATTFRPWLITDDMKGTFEAKINIPIPENEEARKAIIKAELGKIRVPTYKEGDIENLAKNTVRFSRYQILRIIRYALARNFNNVEAIAMKEDAERLSHMVKEDMDKVSAIIKADLAEEDEPKHQEFITANPTAN